MRLYLSGGGSGQDSAKINELFAKAIEEGKKMLYIPIAIDTDRHPYPSCLEYITGEFRPFGFTNIAMLTDLSKITRKEIDEIGGVYIGGGNTPKLLNEMKKTRFIEHLKYLAGKNIPLAGGSAGAIIFGKTIIPSLSQDENECGLTDFSGLNLIKGYDLLCHYEKKMDSEIIEYKKKYKLGKMIALPENCGLYVNEKYVEIVGPGKAALFGGNKKAYRAGKKLN